MRSSSCNKAPTVLLKRGSLQQQAELRKTGVRSLMSQLDAFQLAVASSLPFPNADLFLGESRVRRSGLASFVSASCYAMAKPLRVAALPCPEVLQHDKRGVETV